jgi:acetolactate synthase small subunit
MIKLKTNGAGNTEIVEHLNSYGGKVLDIGAGYVTADLTEARKKSTSS